MISCLLLNSMNLPPVEQVKYEPKTGVARISNISTNSRSQRVTIAKLTTRKSGRLSDFAYSGPSPVLALRWNYNDDVRSPEYAFYLLQKSGKRVSSKKIFSTSNRSAKLVPSTYPEITTFLVRDQISDGWGPSYKVEVNQKSLKTKKYEPTAEASGFEVRTANGDIVFLQNTGETNNARIKLFVNPTSLPAKSTNGRWVSGQPNWPNKLRFHRIESKALGNGIYETTIAYSHSNKNFSVRVKDGVTIQLGKDCDYMLLNGENSHLVELKSGKVLWTKPLSNNVRYWLR